MTLEQLLRASGLPWLEARMLAEHAFGRSPADIAAGLRDAPEAGPRVRFDALAARRRGGEPMAYILGEREFYGRVFAVTPDVLIPRPETELLCEAALERLAATRGARVLDLGTGSGAIALTLACERPDLELTAVDVSPAALAVARRNARRLGAADRVHWVESDWFTALPGRRFDLIVGNPPYIEDGDAHLAQGDLRFEPRDALAAGPDGLAALHAIARTAPAHLENNRHGGGWLLLEHGWQQGEACRKALSTNGFGDIATLRDLAGHERVTVGRRRAG